MSIQVTAPPPLHPILPLTPHPHHHHTHTHTHRNPGVRTIEEELLEALCKAGAFPEDIKDNLGKVSNEVVPLAATCSLTLTCKTYRPLKPDPSYETICSTFAVTYSELILSIL